MRVKILAILLCVVVTLILPGCGLWEGAPFQVENIETPSPSYAELATEADK